MNDRPQKLAEKRLELNKQRREKRAEVKAANEEHQLEDRNQMGAQSQGADQTHAINVAAYIPQPFELSAAAAAGFSSINQYEWATKLPETKKKINNTRRTKRKQMSDDERKVENDKRSERRREQKARELPYRPVYIPRSHDYVNCRKATCSTCSQNRAKASLLRMGVADNKQRTKAQWLSLEQFLSSLSTAAARACETAGISREDMLTASRVVHRGAYAAASSCSNAIVLDQQ